MEDFVDAYNDRDWERCAALMAAPHFKVDVGMVREWSSREELVTAFRHGPWHFVTGTRAEPVQGGERSVTVALDGVIDGGDRSLSALFFVVNKGNGWGIQARSIIET